MQYKNKDLVNDYTLDMLNTIKNNNSLFSIMQHICLDNELQAHSMNVAKLATQLAITLDLSDSNIRKVCLAGYLHDCAKLLIDLKILYKPGSLTDEEFEVIKKHPVDGYNFCKQSGVDEEICNMVLKHHVKKESKGYPTGFTEKTLPEEIITVADIFSALSEKRTYHSALEYRQALDFIDSFDDLNKEVLEALRRSFDD